MNKYINNDPVSTISDLLNNINILKDNPKLKVDHSVLCRCESCNREFSIKYKSWFLDKNRDKLLCKNCKIKYTKSLQTEEEKRLQQQKREKTNLEKSNGLYKTSLLSNNAIQARKNLDYKAINKKSVKTKKDKERLLTEEERSNLKRKRSNHMLSILDKSKQTSIERYGSSSYFNVINRNRKSERFDKIQENIKDFSELSVTKDYYINNNVYPLELRCKLCGLEYKNTRTRDIKRCPSCFPEDWCSKGSSKGEKVIQKFLKDNNILFITEKTFSNLVGDDSRSRLRFDFYLPEYNSCIEYQGKQHFIPYDNSDEEKILFEKRQRYDTIKKEYCKNNNIKLFEITYKDNIKTSLSKIIDSLM